MSKLNFEPRSEMIVTELDSNEHNVCRSLSVLQPRPTIGFGTFRPITPRLKYQTPKPISFNDSSSSSSASTGTSTVDSPPHLDPTKPAAISHRSSHLPLLCRKRDRRDVPQEAKKCPLCRAWSCPLVSHKLYASRIKRLQLQSSNVNNEQTQTPFALEARQSQPPIIDEKNSHTFLAASVGRIWTKSCFNLPRGCSDPDMRRHFQDFFTTQISSMMSPVRVRAFDVAYCPVIIHHALADPALCHSVIAMAATYSAIHRRSLRTPDAKLLSIYGRTFETLRQQAGQARQSKQLEITIMTTLNLLMYHGLAFGDKPAMVSYLTAVKSLVDICGGICNLSTQAAVLSLWASLYVTLYTGKKPLFLEQARIMPEIPLSNPPAVIYGSSWATLRAHGLIPQSLLHVCLDTCRLTELLEDRVSGNIHLARWEYFNYKRNAMAMKNGKVHSELFGSGTKAECISLVHNLFLFLVLRLMPWNAPLINLCEQLRCALLASGLHDYWDQDIDVLLWVIFMLMAGSDCWSDKNWALELLLNTLSHHYRCEQPNWPPGWCEMQHLSLMKFTWSDIYLTDSFKATCRDLIAMS